MAWIQVPRRSYWDRPPFKYFDRQLRTWLLKLLVRLVRPGKLGQFELEFFIFWCNIKRTSNITCKNILLNLKRALLDRLIPKIDSESLQMSLSIVQEKNSKRI